MNRSAPGHLVLICGVWLSAVSCSLFYFPDTAAVVTFPEQDNQVLEETQCPRVLFPFAVEQTSVEAIFTVRDFHGGVPGSYQWEGSTVSFHAEPDLIRGARYVLCLQGVFRDAGGVECSIDRLVPFYLGSAGKPAPYVVWSAPATGQTTSPDTEIVIAFSADMDPLTLAPALVLSPDCDLEERWEEGTSRLVLSPRPSWQNLTVYTLELGARLRDLTGTPLQREAQIVFLVQEDITSPTVLSVRPAFNDAQGLYPETGADLEGGVACRDALRVSFSEAMDRSSTAGAFTLTPPVTGSLAWLDDATLVFCPLTGYAAGTTYLLSFGSAAADAAGNPLAGLREMSFTPAVQTISVTTELVYDAVRIAPGEYSTGLAREIRTSVVHGEYALVFEFAGARFDADSEKAAVQECIRLACLFPPAGVLDARPVGYSWTGDDRLSVTFAGLEVSTAAQSYYYLLSLRGGETGIRSDEGGLLEEDLEQLLLTRDRG
jgi:hypothetical protein